MILALAIAIGLVLCAFLFAYWVNQYFERRRCTHDWANLNLGQRECRKCGRFELFGGTMPR